jgi:hypothetical protein
MLINEGINCYKPYTIIKIKLSELFKTGQLYVKKLFIKNKKNT